MKTFCSHNEFLKSSASSEKFAVTIGIFDGVHRGHQEIIKTLIKKARQKDLSTLLITFHPHPAKVLGLAKKVPLLISLKHRMRLLAEMGLDYIMILRFDSRLSGMSPAFFIREILGKLSVREIIVGKNFFFGKKKKGSLKDLEKFSDFYKYNVDVVKAVKSSGKIISSTRIRKLILDGDLKKASKLLSRPVAVLGTVIKGHKRGRIIGYPTANIDPHHEAIPPSGVYAVWVKLNGKLHKGILNIGVRPTFHSKTSQEKDPTIEVHIFNFNKSIYGRDLEIMFVEEIRKEKKFKNVACLREQIRKDEKRAKRILR